MPELPEVQTTVNGLNKKVLRRAFVDAWSDWKKTVKKPKNIFLILLKILGWILLSFIILNFILLLLVKSGILGGFLKSNVGSIHDEKRIVLTDDKKPKESIIVKFECGKLNESCDSYERIQSKSTKATALVYFEKDLFLKTLKSESDNNSRVSGIVKNVEEEFKKKYFPRRKK